MLAIGRHDERLVEKDLLGLPERDTMPFPVLFKVALIPIKPGAALERVVCHHRSIYQEYTPRNAPVGRLTVGRSAASRASEASGPSESEGGESAARMRWTPPLTRAASWCQRQSESCNHRKEESVNHPTTIAVDLAKSVFEIAVSDRPGRVCQRRRLSRAQMIPFFSQCPPATVLLEACGSSHHWGRQIEKLGHRILLLPAQHVRRYVLRDKTDRADATALLEAHRNEQIVPVPIKTLHQQTLAVLHRIRSGWLATRTARINGIRGLLRELGVFIPQGPRHVLPGLAKALSDPSCPVPESLHQPLLHAASEIRELESRIRAVERQLKTLAGSLPATARLMTVPGIGLLTSTALIGFVGDPTRFSSGRRFASYFGLVPRERSSGLQRHLGAITKRGDAYLRTLLIHGARSTLYAASRSPRPDRLGRWAIAVRQRRGHNRAAVALANKLARIAWAVWSRDTVYQPTPSTTA